MPPGAEVALSLTAYLSYCSKKLITLNLIHISQKSFMIRYAVVNVTPVAKESLI